MYAAGRCVGVEVVIVSCLLPSAAISPAGFSCPASARTTNKHPHGCALHTADKQYNPLPCSPTLFVLSRGRFIFSRLAILYSMVHHHHHHP